MKIKYFIMTIALLLAFIQMSNDEQTNWYNNTRNPVLKNEPDSFWAKYCLAAQNVLFHEDQYYIWCWGVKNSNFSSTVIGYATQKIFFEILKNSYVLGNLVLDVVNEVNSGDYHEVKFAASELSSGVYIYKLRAGEYVDSKKMIVLR